MKKYYRNIGFVIIVVFFILLFSTAHASYTFNYTTYDYPDKASTYVLGINNNIELVGYYTPFSNSGGFHYDGSSYNLVNCGWGTEPWDINDSGLITGRYWDGVAFGFEYDGSSYSTFSVPGADSTKPTGINNSGLVTGYYENFIGGSMQTLGFLKDGADFTTISVPGSTDTLAYGINNNGDVSGFFLDSDGSAHGFIYDGISYTTIDYPGATNTGIYGINNAGWLVGWYRTSPYGSSNFLFNGVNYIPINFSGADEIWAESINDNNQIAGYYEDGSGSHGFVATLVPIPSAVFLLFSGITGLFFIRRGSKTGTL